MVQTWLPVLALALFSLSLPYFTGTNDLFWTAIALVAILGTGLIAALWLFWNRQPISLSLPETLLLGFVMWQWFTVSTSVYRWASLLEASRWTAFTVVVLAVRHLSDERRRLWFAVAFLGAATVTAMHGIAEYALNAASGIPHWRIFGPFLQPNLFGNFLLLAFFVSLGIAFKRPHGWVLTPTLTSILLLVAIALTGSKGALLALLVGISSFGAAVAVSLNSPPNAWRVFLFSSIPAVSALIIFAALLPPIRLRLETLWTAQVNSWMFRLIVWKATLIGSLSKPLTGFGAGTFEWAYPQFTTVGFTRHAHNGFLQTAIESGFVGLILQALFFVTTLGSRSTLQSNPKTLDPIRFSCKAALAAFCFHNLVETAWMTLANLISLAVICGIALSEIQPIVKIQRHWQLILLLPVLVGLWHSISVARGAYFGRQSQKELLPSTRLYWLELAGEADPLNARYLIDRAILLEAWGEATGDEGLLEKALQLCDKAIHLQPTRSGNYKVKARILKNLGRFREAEKALTVALKLNRTDTEAILKLGELLEATGERERAVRLYRRLIALEKTDYGRYKPVDQWHDIFIAAGKIRLSNHLIRERRMSEVRKLLSEAEATLKAFLDNYLPILKASDLEAAESLSKFAETLQDEIKRLQEERLRQDQSTPSKFRAGKKGEKGEKSRKGE